MAQSDFHIHAVSPGMTGFPKPLVVVGGPWSTSERPAIDFKQISGLVVRERGVMLPWDDLQFDRAIEEMAHIEYLDVEYDSTIRLPSLASLKKLKRLRLHAPKVSGTVALCGGVLEEADVRWNKKFNGLLAERQLRTLNITFGWTETTCGSLSELTNLTSLEINYPRSLESLAGLEGLRKLTSLQIHSAPHLSSIDAISHLERLESLSLTDCADIRSLDPLAGLTKLKQLSLFSTKVQDGRVSLLRKLPSLRHAHMQQYPHYDDNWSESAL
jgi:Leucine-rich repeat (LRR) protein